MNEVTLTWRISIKVREKDDDEITEAVLDLDASVENLVAELREKHPEVTITKEAGA